MGGIQSAHCAALQLRGDGAEGELCWPLQASTEPREDGRGWGGGRKGVLEPGWRAEPLASVSGA